MIRSRTFKRTQARRMTIMRFLTANQNADFREIAVAGGYKSTCLQSVTDHLDALEADGWIRRMAGRARAIEVLRPVHSVINGKPYFFVPGEVLNTEATGLALPLSSEAGGNMVEGVGFSHDIPDPLVSRDEGRKSQDDRIHKFTNRFDFVPHEV